MKVSVVRSSRLPGGRPRRAQDWRARKRSSRPGSVWLPRLRPCASVAKRDSPKDQGRTCTRSRRRACESESRNRL
eukprot:8769200-Alexandrium_andersonii.AAC.1